MIGVNRWTGIGNLTDDPKYSRGERGDDSDRCEFSIAINKPSRDREEPPPTYIDIVTWGKLAGQVDQYARKGRLVYVEGEIEIREWKDRETEARRRAYRIKAFTVRFLDAPKDDDRGRGRGRDDRDRGRDERPRRSDRDDEPRDRSRDESGQFPF